MRQDAISQILNAAVTAAQWHAKQRRKASASIPYINHLLEVAKLVDQATGGKDTDLVIAALLHDAIEDQGISRAQISGQFGEEVATLVEEVSDDKSLPRDVRKHLQVERAAAKSPRAKILKLADKISNVTDIGKDPPPDWPVQRQRHYVRWGRDVGPGLRGASPELKQLFDDAAAEADRRIVAADRIN
jgi:GTP diphosphokinase / guanosine-3',5'-bis(diphosphate) 3'-diphosphatase